jgi:hypothetical protein
MEAGFQCIYRGSRPCHGSCGQSPARHSERPGSIDGQSVRVRLVVSKVALFRSQWPRGLRRRSAATRLLGLWVRIPRGDGRLSVVSVVCCQVEVSATS